MLTLDKTTSALIVIDLQYDFLPAHAGHSDGALAVPCGEEVIEPIGKLIRDFDTVVLTQDWHPREHRSFASAHDGKAAFDTVEMPYGTQVLWPDHCVQGGHGAELALEAPLIDRAQMILRKGMNPDVDSYSAFLENDKATATGLAGWLRERGVTDVVLCGLATDFCVAFSALDARALGFEVHLVEAACRGISAEGVAAQLAAMREAGVHIV